MFDKLLEESPGIVVSFVFKTIVIVFIIAIAQRRAACQNMIKVVISFYVFELEKIDFDVFKK